MRRYRFIVGVTLSALEEELNRIMSTDESAKLNQVLYAQGSGFIGVVEQVESNEVLQAKQIDQHTNPRRNQERSQKKF